MTNTVSILSHFSILQNLKSPICVVGILFYLFPTISYYSIRSTIILINGLIYHASLKGNYYMLTFDYLCNFFIGLYTSYYYPHTFLPGLISILLNFCNMIAYYGFNVNQTTVDIIHVLTVHFPFLYLIITTS